MKINAKRLRLALRSPGNFFSAARYVLRNGPLGRLERRFLNGYSFKPNLISINITGRCNLRCEMCMQPRADAGAGKSATVGGGKSELTPEQWRAVVDGAASARPAFYFTGGEPLLYKGLDSVLEHVKRRGMIAALVTNGTVLARHAERLVEIGVDNVTVSLDGPEDVHDFIRSVPGSFRRATEGIRALQEARRRAALPYPAIKVNCVITPTSYSTLAETRQLVRDLGVDELNFQHPIFDTAENVALHNRVFPKAMGAESVPGQSKEEGEFYEGRFSEEQYAELERILQGILSDSGKSPNVLFFPEVASDQWKPYYLDLDYPFQRRCRAPWTQMRLLADGTFEPCLHYVVGNVLEAPLWELWNAPSMRHFRRALTRNQLFPACARCCYRIY